VLGPGRGVVVGVELFTCGLPPGVSVFPCHTYGVGLKSGSKTPVWVRSSGVAVGAGPDNNPPNNDDTGERTAPTPWKTSPDDWRSIPPGTTMSARTMSNFKAFTSRFPLDKRSIRYAVHSLRSRHSPVNAFIAHAPDRLPPRNLWRFNPDNMCPSQFLYLCLENYIYISETYSCKRKKTNINFLL
jgi:hypothetical protein